MIDGRGSYSIDQQRYNGQFGGHVFWEIKNGKSTRMVTDVTYNAITTDFWGNLDAISGKESWQMYGTGGDAKGQPTQTQQHLARLAVAAHPEDHGRRGVRVITQEKGEKKGLTGEREKGDAVLLVFSLDVDTAREDGWDRSASVRGLAVLLAKLKWATAPSAAVSAGCGPIPSPGNRAFKSVKTV